MTDEAPEGTSVAAQVKRWRSKIVATLGALGAIALAVIPIVIELRHEWEGLRANVGQANSSAFAMQRKVDELQASCAAEVRPQALFVLASPEGQTVAQDVPTMAACEALRAALIANKGAGIPACVAR